FPVPVVRNRYSPGLYRIVRTIIIFGARSLRKGCSSELPLNSAYGLHPPFHRSNYPRAVFCCGITLHDSSALSGALRNVQPACVLPTVNELTIEALRIGRPNQHLSVAAAIRRNCQVLDRRSHHSSRRLVSRRLILSITVQSRLQF